MGRIPPCICRIAELTSSAVIAGCVLRVNGGRSLVRPGGECTGESSAICINRSRSMNANSRRSSGSSASLAGLPASGTSHLSGSRISTSAW